MGRPPSDARERSLAAAYEIVCRDGAHALTIQQTADEAGLSKGGLLHHFPTKNALVRALVEETVRKWEGAVEAEAARDPQPVGRFVRGFLRAMSDPSIATLGRGLLGAVALNGELLEPLRESMERVRLRLLADGIDPAAAYKCVLVADALWFHAMFDLPPPPDDVLKTLMAQLEESTRHANTE